MFGTVGQTLEFNLNGVKQQLDAYDQTAETVAVYIRHKFSRLWSGSAGLSLTHDEVVQEGTATLYQLVALPITAGYDSTGIPDALQDPVTGLRASAALTPTHAFGNGGLSFLVMQASASTYFDLAQDGRSVLALRALAGTILGGSNLEVPPDQRLYAGGSATVRGYAYQSIGPQFPSGNPVGAEIGGCGYGGVPAAHRRGLGRGRVRRCRPGQHRRAFHRRNPYRRRMWAHVIIRPSARCVWMWRCPLAPAGWRCF